MSSLRALRVDTVDLLRRPGTRRRVDTTVSSADLDVVDDRVDDPIAVGLDVTSTVDGIVVTGTVAVAWGDECRRCLVAIDRRVDVDVDELYQQEVVDPDAFEIGHQALDLTPMVRDQVVLALSGPPPLCRAGCAGICPVCGSDRNAGDCGCDTAVRDERWAALDQLREPDDGATGDGST